MLQPHKEGSAGSKIVVALSAYLRFLALLVTQQVSIVHLHVAMRGSFWRKSIFALTARLFGRPTIFHLHGSETKDFYHSLGPLSQKLVKIILEAQSRVVVLSESWSRFVKEVAPTARVVVVPNYVDLPDVPALGPRDTKIRILFLGAVGPRKGINDLVHAFAGVLNLIPEAKVELHVGGDGAIEEARALAEQLGVEREITFHGWISGTAKESLLREASIYCLPSYNEGLPVSVLEAMSYGVPVVTTRVGGLPELIADGVNGFLINPGDRGALVHRLVELSNSVALRAEVGEAGRRTVSERHSANSSLNALNNVYSEFS